MRNDKERELREWLEEQCRSISGGDEELLTLSLGTPSPDQEHRYDAKEFLALAPLAVPPLKLGLLDHLISGRKNRRVLEHEHEVLVRANELERWSEAKRAHEAEQARLRRRHEKLRLKDPGTMAELLEEAMAAVGWPRETIVSFDLQNGGTRLFLDVDFPELEDMPSKSAELAARGLKLNIKERSNTQLRKLYMTHVHAVIFRVLGETFATLPSLTEVVCSGFSQRNDPATGNARDDYLVSVRVTRDQWRQLNFSALGELDVVACLGSFDLRRDMTKSAVFAPIEPFGPPK